MSEMYFKKFETVGKTKDEAIKAADELNLMVDATQKFNKWAKENPTNEEDKIEWLKNYLRDKKYDKPGLGAYIVLQAGVKDTRERPYKVNKKKYEKRTHSFEKMYIGRAQDTGAEIFSVKTSKAAEQEAKDWIVANQRGVDIFVEARIKEKNALYATVDYTPSKGSQPYKLLCFGYVKA